jgi:uncharacterized protein (TIGR02996 family)
LSASRLQLEQAVDQAPDDSERYAVLGDWLAQAGDPRGELIALQLGDRSSSSARSREAELLSTRGLRISRAKRAQWRWGYIHTLAFDLTGADGWEAWRVPDGDRTWASELLGPELTHPSCRFLRELVVEGDPGDVALRWLSTHPPAVLRSLQLVSNEVDLATVGAGLERLERLAIASQFITPATLALPRLRELQLPLDALPARSLALVLDALRPTLRAMTVTSLEGVDAAALAPLFELRALDSLTVRADAMGRGAVDALEASPLKEQLVTLDLSRSGLSEEATKRLLKRAGQFPKLSSLLLGET